MSSKRYISAFDEEEDVSEQVDECFEVLSDSGEDSYNSDAEAVVYTTKVVESDQQRIDKLNKKYKKSLDECYETLKDKLTWKNTPTYTPVSLQEIECEQTPFAQPAVAFKRVGRVKSTRPLNVDIVSENNSSITFYVPKPVEKNSKICKFIETNKTCPYGDNCRFSHKTQPKRQPYQDRMSMTTANGKTKKIWMCRNWKATKSCRFGANCPYAHSEEEVKSAVSTCYKRLDCDAVAKHGDQYVNVGDRKCMRLHPKERIDNFIARTS